MKIRSLCLVAMVALATAVTAPAQDEKLKPYRHSGSDSGTIEEKLPAVKDALTANGFEIAGEYEPFDGAHVIAITSDALKQNAAASDFGGFGAVARVSLTQAGNAVQVAWTDPCYLANVYALHAKFRIALSFPDLGMVTFMKISGAPKAIQKALQAVAVNAGS